MKRFLSVLALLALASLGLAQTYDANGRQKVNVETGAVTVSGTVAATQSGNFTVQPITFASAQAVTGTFWQATQPVSGTFWQATQPVSGTFYQATQPVSIASMPSTPVTGTFFQATQPISIEQTGDNNAVDVLTLPTLATVTTVGTVTNLTNLPNEGQQTAANSISVTPDTDNDAVGAAGAAPPGEYVAIGGVTSGATGGFLGGIPVCDTFARVNVSTATTTLIVTGVSGRHVRICSLSLVTAAANIVTLISGTGATCGTGTTGMAGGTGTAGYSFAANGGIAFGSGVGAINQTTATGDSVCAVTSAATQLSGSVGYTIY